MPELPEVETVCKGLRPILVGEKIINCTTNVSKLRNEFPQNFPNTIINTTVSQIQRRGKYILIHLDNHMTWVIHLGMSGQIRGVPCHEFTAKKHDHVIWQTKNHIFAYNDPRKFGCMMLLETSQWEKNLPFCEMGVEPFDEKLTPDFLSVLLKNKKLPIKAALLDQKIISGLGNIYVCEALWMSKISPQRSSNSLNLGDLKILINSIQNVLKLAIDAGGTTLKDHRTVDGKQGLFQNFCKVYGQLGNNCKTLGCEGVIDRIIQSGRSSFFCNICQK